MYIDRYCNVCGREWQGHLVGPCPFCQIVELKAKNTVLQSIIQAMQEARAGDVTTIDEILEKEETDG